MKLPFSLLGALCLLHSVMSQCDLSNRSTEEKDFPNLDKESVLSYQMGVEYTLPNVSQSDYYLEYYDILNRKGRVEAHQEGDNLVYIYRANTWEAWNIRGGVCKLLNITDTAEIFRDDMTDWLYVPSDYTKRIVGPSAMFKIAYDEWNSASRKSKMAYMGEVDELVRGMKAQRWRRCLNNIAYADYYFTVKEVENPYNLEELTVVPLRVIYRGKREFENKVLNDQDYEIMTFQPMISLGEEPFELPKGKNCRRGIVPNAPELPNFSGRSMLLSAEVVYRRIKNSTKEELSSYYSTLMFAMDTEINHLAYYYAPWNTTKPLGGDKMETIQNLPEYSIYDMKFEYLYKIKYATGKCDFARTKGFAPKYVLPEGGGSLNLANPYVLFPNNELYYLTNSSERGMEVDVFETMSLNFLLDEETQIDKAIITHSYLKPNEIMENTASVRRAPVQIALRFYRTKDVEEILTFNIFGFTTRLIGRRALFDVRRCFPNDDDYSWLTLGFEPDNAGEADPITIARRLWGIRKAVMSFITTETALTPLRVPIILITPRPSAIYVTMLILGRPPVELDFEPPEENKVIDTDDMEGISDMKSCAANCLERGECWGISLCDNVCYFGSKDKQGIKTRSGCSLYRRYSNDSYSMPTKEVSIKAIQMQVEEDSVKLKVPTLDNKEIILIATSSFVSTPAEDDSYFNRLGREVNQRMRVVKVGKKLKKADIVKNMGSLNFEQCQRVCLDFKDCETVSYCLKGSVCAITTKHGEDIKDDDMEEDFHCNIVSRRYGDYFTRSPGIVLSQTAAKIVKVTKVEECAKACVKETSFRCLSFDHCASEPETPCRLHTVHVVNAKTRESIQKKSTRCGHYIKRFSIDFKKTSEKRMVGTKVPPINNVTLEECAKICMEYGNGVCYGYDYCQDRLMLATSCILLDSDPSAMKSTYSPICTNFLRSEQQFQPRPYTTGYAAGIGALCFFVGLVVGAVILFIVAYLRVNRR